MTDMAYGYIPYSLVISSNKMGEKEFLFMPLVSHTSGIYCFYLPFSLLDRGKDKARFSSGSSLFIPADIRFKSMWPTTDLTPRFVFCSKKTSIWITIQLWGLRWIHLSRAMPPQLSSVRFSLLVELISSITAWASATGWASNWCYLTPIGLKKKTGRGLRFACVLPCLKPPA